MKRRLLLRSLLLLSSVVFTFSPAYAQAEKPIKISRNGRPETLKLALSYDESNPGGALNVQCDEIIEVHTPDGVRLESSNPGVVRIVGDRHLVAGREPGTAEIRAYYPTGRAATPHAAEIAPTRPVVDPDGNVLVPGSPGSPERPAVNAVSPNTEFRLSDRQNGRLFIRTGRTVTYAVEAVPKFFSYKDVKDAFGSRVAQNYVVVQVRIYNSMPDKKFLIKNVSAKFDPHQCTLQKDRWPGFDDQKCMEAYKRFFQFPINHSANDNTAMLGVAEVERYRSKRYRLFQALRWVADVGGGLSTFNLLGKDGVKAFAFMGSTLFNATDAALPKVAIEQKERLEKMLPKPNTIVGDDPVDVNLFIPAAQVLSADVFKVYKKTAAKISGPSLDHAFPNYARDFSESEFHRYIILFLVANASGTLIDRNAQQVDAKQGGGAPLFQRP